MDRIDLGQEGAPCETTACKFRHLLEKHGLADALFAAVGTHLMSVIAREAQLRDDGERPSAVRLGRESRQEAIRRMARLEGFEPPTNGFGSHYSIRLSYRRVGRDGGASRAGILA